MNNKKKYKKMIQKKSFSTIDENGKLHLSHSPDEAIKEILNMKLPDNVPSILLALVAAFAMDEIIRNLNRWNKGKLKMTIESIKIRLDTIKNTASDFERAHSKENRLWEDFIKFVRSGTYEPGELRKMAKQVLKSKKIDFPRYFA